MTPASRFLAGVIFLSAIFASGCAASSANRGVVESVAVREGFERSEISTTGFTIFSYSKITDPKKPLTIYIEGDGLAWRGRRRLSSDPTPRHLLVLELATMDPSPNVVYLARPCQFVWDDSCDSTYWSNRRFSEEVIASMDEAVSYFAAKMTSKEIHLVGYSGGGAVAVLVTARRADILSIRTIAGNLNPTAVNEHHRVSPLEGSLDPMEFAEKVSSIRQIHFTGSRDEVVPPFIARSFKKASGDDDIQIIAVDATHHSGWIEAWPDLLTQYS